MFPSLNNPLSLSCEKAMRNLRRVLSQLWETTSGCCRTARNRGHDFSITDPVYFTFFSLRLDPNSPGTKMSLKAKSCLSVLLNAAR